MVKYEAPAVKVYELNAEDIVATSSVEVETPNQGGGATGNWGGDGGFDNYD